MPADTRDERGGAVRVDLSLLSWRQGTAGRRGNPCRRRDVPGPGAGDLRSGWPRPGRDHSHLAATIRTAFAAAADNLIATDYTDACPIATIALEVASTDEALRHATAEVFTDWIEQGAERIADTGLPPSTRRRLMLGFITSLEGAFVLSRALRDPEPLFAAGETVAAAVTSALATAATQTE